MSKLVRQAKIAQAVELLKAGKLVAFPTETVYGLGADASNSEAVKKIFAAKGRPADHPLIVHLADCEQLNQWARDIPSVAWELAQQFWPGPLTLILKRAEHVSDLITGGQDTVGLRIPSHPIAQTLLTQFGGGIAAPSANRFGHVSPTQAAHVQQELGNAVDLILDGGACTLGIESTIIDVSSTTPRLLRPGSILPSQLNKIIQLSLAETTAFNNKQTKQLDNSVRAPGMLESHYAPATPLKIIVATELSSLVEELAKQGKQLSVLAHSLAPIKKYENISWFSMPLEAHNYAHELYTTMRAADAQKGDMILIEAIPNTEEWSAIWDRLRKASA